MEATEILFQATKELFTQAYLQGVEDGRKQATENKKPLSSKAEICEYLSVTKNTLDSKFHKGDYGNTLTMNGRQYYFFPEEFKKYQMQNYEFLLKK